jgi:putative PIN family toxin of toxin-antitoxin system
MKRIVCDTNILVSGLLWKGAPRRILTGIEQGNLSLFTSRELLEELDRVLSYRRLATILEKGGVTRQAVLRWVVRHATIVMVKPLDHVVVTDDPSDDNILACAVSASADAIVSGDKHLLSLGKHAGIPIMKAAGFMEKNAG